MTKTTHTSRSLSALLMVGASSLALATPAKANEYLFTSETKPLQIGERQTQTEKLTQISLTNGGTASFTDNAEYQINADGSIELYKGSVTIAGGDGTPKIVRMPDGLKGEVLGRGSSANFTVGADGEASGHALTGQIRVGRNNRMRTFAPSAMWAAKPGKDVRRVVANDAQTAPEAGRDSGSQEPQVAAIGGDAGPVGAALNGIPVTLGDALAAAGASSDILSAARRVELGVGNAQLDTFPSGDLALLVARAAEIENANGGSPFPQAQADIIRAYLSFLANGGTGAQFLPSFSAFSLDYLDLIRAGGVPSAFGEPGLADINAYLAFIDRTGALAQLSASDRLLAEAYLGFLRDGGNPDLFAGTFTNLTEAFFAFVRAGNAPADFQDASQAALGQTIAFLSDSGLVQQLSAADQALVNAFLANGGLAFAGQFQTALDDYFAFLSAGGLPSAYEPVDQAALRQFLETLSDTGLLNSVLGDQAQFYADYLAFLRGGGDVDAFAGLPVNIFTDYAAQLAAYRAFLDAGNLPSAFAGSDPALLQGFIDQLQAAGALERFVGADAAFFSAFAAFVNDGGAFDAFAGLNANIFAGYAADLQAYFAFLEAGGVPTTYEPLSQELIAQYLAELQAAGAKARFLPELADFYRDYFAFISDGGNPDNFAGLPVPPDFGAFAAALNAYADFLASGGFPADFDGNDLSVLASFIEALGDAGELDARLGSNADLLQAYFAFLAAGGAPNQFAGLPIFADYVAELNAYFAFLAGGGFPQDYTQLDQATLNSFLAALRDAQGGLAGFGDLNAFFADYAAFVLGGGDPTAFTGLPIYAQYVADLNAYFAFLANGGLPEDYTVLDPATLTAYLEALAAAQGGLASFAGLDDFFDAYAAFVLGGGDPNAFASLPVFDQYIADLNAYFAFLAAGGLPSEYTVLDQATLNAYLEALANAQGGLAGFAGLNAFFIDFFAFVQGGGNPDQFAGLPDGIGNDFPDFYAAQFGNNPRARGADRVLVEDDGQITRIEYPNSAPLAFGEGDQILRERGREGDIVAWTRYENGAGAGGVTNSNDHLIAGAPAINLPASGTVQYALVGGTLPTDFFAEAGQTGFFDGRLAVAFGSTNRVGLEFDVLSLADEGVRGWRVETSGGADDPANSGLIIAPDSSFQSNNQTISISGIEGIACTQFCNASVSGSLFGDGASHAGFAYQINDQAGARMVIQGSAVFGANAAALDGLGTRPVVTPPVPTGTGTPLILDFANEFGADSPIGVVGFSAPFENEDSLRPLGSDQNAFADVTVNGAVNSLGGDFLGLSIGTARATDVSGNDRHLIGRWTDGTVNSTFFTEIPYSTAQGAHYFVSAPIGTGFAFPTTGTIEYELLAATAPTVADGQQAPGQFEAGIILSYGASEIGLALDALITIPDDAGDFTYRITTPGGLDNPEQSFFVLNTFGQGRFDITIGGGHITDSAGVCAQNTTADCRFNATGAFSGDDVDQFALSYTAFHPDRDEGQSISGAAIFGATSNTGGNALAGGVEDFDTSVLVTAAISYGEEGFTRTSRTNQTDVSADGVLNSIGSFGRGTAVGDQIIGDEYAIVGRWIDGDVVFPTGARSYTTTANDASHWAIASVVNRDFTLTGQITYDLLGATTPTYSDGRTAPGTFDGSLSINWQSPTQIALDFAAEVTMPDAVYAWSFQSPNFATRLQGVFESNATIDGTACANNGCQAAVSYQFGGENLGERFAINYNISIFAEDLDIGGSALFGAPGTFDPANYPNTATSAVADRSLASIAPSISPISSLGIGSVGDWSRWGGTGSASPQGLGVRQDIGLLPPGAIAAGVEGRPNAAMRSREAAIRQVERIMGGAISFARPGEMGHPQ